MFQPTGIVVIFNLSIAIGKGNRHIDFCAVFRLVGAITDFALCLPELYGSQCILSNNFFYMVDNSILIQEFRRFKLTVHLIAKNKLDAVIHNRLTFNDV